MAICLGLLDEQPDELVVDRPLDVDPRVRRALLAAEPEGAAHDPLGRLVEVGVARHDGRVLAAHLDDARSRPRLRERVEQAHPDLVRAGEHDAVDAGVVLERLADRVARAHDEVDDALGNAGVDVGLMRLTDDSGDALEGLRTTVLPAMQRGARSGRSRGPSGS